MTLLEKIAAIKACALDGKDTATLTRIIDVLIGEVERAQAGADGLFVNMALTHRIKDLSAEIESLRAAIQELTKSRDKWASRAAESRDDAARYLAIRRAILADDLNFIDRIRMHLPDTREGVTAEIFDFAFDAAMKGSL